LAVPGVSWLLYVTNKKLIADGIEGAAKAAGYEVVYPYTGYHDGGSEIVYVRCTPTQLAALETDFFECWRRGRVWQNSYFAVGNGGFSNAGGPTCLSSWASQFEKFIARLWFDTTHPLAGACAEWQGPNAGDPQLTPLVLTCRASGVHELDNPLTAIYFADYLSEYPERREAWDAFEAAYGPVQALYWQNDIGKAWEAQNGPQGERRHVAIEGE
jgi:hypothetical protein